MGLDGQTKQNYPYQGGTGGKPFDDFHPDRKVISHIRIRADKTIDAIQVVYKDDPEPTQLHGGDGGDAYEFYLEEGETIVEITGRADKYIDQLVFVVSTGRSSPTYGGDGGQPFSWTAEDGYHFRHFTGRSDKRVDGLQPFFEAD
ncbi:hypothetical protein JR316_0002871 [Psilocybe cubensis]|uniref:Uncharacterized protein n=2 Tax=Psilocybe cubensis TaxID=181762 RepID=A0ACB8H6Q2_PSICU|nr:hypothetical protein JR316_0002871 [Psilocybe cubensis]KAH9483405.1 hypothetical protein JR316_0002871 [Psilocybe cubensis]